MSHGNHAFWMPSLIIVGLTLSSTYMMLSLPGHAWDGLTYWFDVSINVHEHLHRLGSGKNQPYTSDDHHPLTLNYLLALAVPNDGGASTISAWAFPWALIMLSGAIVQVGFLYYYTSSVLVSNLGLLFLISIPLIENNYAIAGYADYCMTFYFFAGVVCLSLYLDVKRISFLILGSALIAVSVIFKNSGPAFFLVTVAAIFLYFFRVSFWQLCCAIVVLVAVGGVSQYIWINGYAIKVGNNWIGFNATEKWLVFGGKRLIFSGVSADEVRANFVHAFLVNSSFSVAGIALLLCFKNALSFRASRLLFIVAMSLLLLLAVFGFTTYGAQYSAPDNDTGLSRFSLPALVFVPSIFWLVFWRIARH